MLDFMADLPTHNRLAFPFSGQTKIKSKETNSKQFHLTSSDLDVTINLNCTIIISSSLLNEWWSVCLVLLNVRSQSQNTVKKSRKKNGEGVYFLLFLFLHHITYCPTYCSLVHRRVSPLRSCTVLVHSSRLYNFVSKKYLLCIPIST